MNPEHRHLQRRLTDEEVEDVLAHARGYMNGSRKRQWALGSVIAACLGAVTLIQILLLNPITKELEEVESRMMNIDSSVRLHHEQSAKEYVLKTDYDADMARILSELTELKGMVMHMGQVGIRGGIR